MVRKKVTSISPEPPNSEQASSRVFVSEDVDIRGLVKRHRVADQTLFDAMLLMEMIDQSHHEAAHLFLDALTQSGAVLNGMDPEPGIRAPAYSVGNSMADRRMAFSGPFRKMVDDCGDEVASYTMSLYSRIYDYRDTISDIGYAAEMARPCLVSLASHYGVNGRRDPRKIVRRQVGHWRK